MKKYFIVLAAAALALSACSKVEVNEAPASRITFQAVNYLTQTKADAPVSVIKDFTAFNCMAYLHAQGEDLTQAGEELTTPKFQNFFGAFPGETISANDTQNPTEWAPSHTYYWPKGEKSYVDFVAWYGTSQPTVVYEMNNNSKWQATMTWNFETTFGQATSNLMYADMAWRFKQNTKAAKYGSSGATEGVPMMFHHALAQINIKAYVDKDTNTGTGTLTPTNPAAATLQDGVTDGIATWTIKLKNAKISKIHKKGTLTLINEDPGTEKTENPWSGDTWVASDTADDETIAELTVNKVGKDNAQDWIAPSCVLPQDLVATATTVDADVVLDFDLEITTTYSDPANPNKEVLHFTKKLGADLGTTAWVKNHKYTYYLRIVPNQNKVLFDPALDADWIEEEATEQVL